jgi:predicted secreted hydrolase
LERFASVLAFVLPLVLLVGCGPSVAPLPEVPLPSPTPAAPVRLPRDAGPHDALTEWWYFTGHLRAEPDQHEYGFEFTIFQVRRVGAPTGYLAHFAITDVQGQRFSHQARVRQGEALSALPLDVDGWTLRSDSAGERIEAAMAPGPGAEMPFALSLRLQDLKPPALHHGGYIEYGAPGGSYYYSRTRIAADGTLRAGDAEAVDVRGEAWMDHQWGNFVVTAAGGWDWFSLQLDDQSELMLYILRGASGETTGVYGTQVLASGDVRELAPGSVEATATGAWQSPHTGGVYPSGWHVALPNGDGLEVRPLLADQELYFPGVGSTMVYWEGAVAVSGDATGRGYVELTGYAGR